MMAEPAQPGSDAGTAAVAVAVAVADMSPSGVKQEHSILDGLDFSMPPPPPHLATKRPFAEFNDGSNGDGDGSGSGNDGGVDDPAKRVKTDPDPPHHAAGNGFDQSDETSLEDGLALLVQNALSNVGDLVGQFNPESDLAASPSDPLHVVDSAEPALPSTFVSDPERFARTASLHALGNLALSMLLALSHVESDDAVKPLRDRDCPHGRCFQRFHTSFGQIKQIYSSAPMLSADELGMHDDEARTILDLANLAQLAAWLVDGGLHSYSLADEHFRTIFRDEKADLAADVVELWLAVKTQHAIESLIDRPEGQEPADVLNNVMIDGPEDLLHGLPGFDLPPATDNFSTALRSRKEDMENDMRNQTEPLTLREKYPADQLLRNFCTSAKSRLATVFELGTRLGLPMPPSDNAEVDILSGAPNEPDIDLDDLSSFFEKTTSGLVQNALAGLTEEPIQPHPIMEPHPALDTPKSPPKAEVAIPQTNGKVDIMTDYKELEALVAESTSNYVKTTLNGLSPVPYQPTVPTSTSELFHGSRMPDSVTDIGAAQSYLTHLHQQQAQAHAPYYTYTQQMPEPQQPVGAPDNLPPNQTCPSAMLYDKARQAALSKSSAHTRREGVHSTRRPWSQEEEKALMAGLDMVKGPHWSQILSLFGQNGTISDILRERTQVQLKDKARNLKLFFLKTNSEMPYYLQAVTGELKTRAPSQAARKEAEERARMNSEEEQARLQGIMTLAGGLQNPPQGRTASNAAAAVGSGVVTPAQAASAAQAASSSQQGSVSQHGHPPPVTTTVQSGYPATSLPQVRPAMPAIAQQALGQAPPRPQTHLPPQTPRPQSQPPQQQQQQQQQNHHLPTSQSPVLPHAAAAAQQRSQTVTPVSQPHHSPAVQHAPPPPPPPLLQSQYALPQPSYSSPPPVPQPPMQHAQADMHHDNTTEAALLQGLQAAMAESS